MVAKCNQCSYATRFPGRTETHKRCVHSDLQLRHCHFLGCNYKTNVPANFRRHQRQHESIQEVRRPFPCEFSGCEYRASHEYLLRNHVRGKYAPGRPKNFRCPMCPAKFYTESGIKAHIPGHIQEKSFKCSLCRFQTHQQGILSAHIKYVHKKMGKRWCHVKGCKYSTTVRADLTEHLRTCHDPKAARPFECNFPPCAYSADFRYKLIRHIDACHNPNRTRNAPCPLCSKAFYNNSDLKNHITKVHTKQTCYNCHKCGFTTPYSGNLTAHYQKEHEDGPRFKCESCDYRACHRSLISSHRMTAHSEQRKFKCDHNDCGYKTNNGVYFRRHSFIHKRNPEDQFPFPCDFPGCDFRRRQNSEIEKHKELHQSSKHEFICKQCPNKCYPDRFSLHFHQCLVHNKRSFKCSVCDFAGSHKDTLTKHIRKHHSQKTSDEVKLSTTKTTARKVIIGHAAKDELRSEMKSKNTSTHFSCSGKHFDSVPVVMLENISVKTM